MKQLSALFVIICLGLSGTALAQQGGSAHCQRHAGQQDADTNGDGFIDKQEAMAMHEKHFDEADTNHDGKLSKEEQKACCKRDGANTFMNADKDNDGTLDREEAKKHPRILKNFDAIDTDKDGTIDHDELHKFMMEKKTK